jgi:hypothetical protein
MRWLHLPLDRLYGCFLTCSEAEYLFAALAAGVAAAATVGVAVSAGTGTVGFATFFDRFTEADNAQARRTGAFHLGDSSHFTFSWCVSL